MNRSGQRNKAVLHACRHAFSSASRGYVSIDATKHENNGAPVDITDATISSSVHVLRNAPWDARGILELVVLELSSHCGPLAIRVFGMIGEELDLEPTRRSARAQALTGPDGQDPESESLRQTSFDGACYVLYDHICFNSLCSPLPHTHALSLMSK